MKEMQPFRILDRQWQPIADFPTLVAARVASIDLSGVAVVEVREIDGEEEIIIHYERKPGLDYESLHTAEIQTE